ncbi:MAG: metallophosphoesterase family protein [Candidatus Staskawiczbacteria bacterium]|nr:metallophosphoesterase family protein [Candidatus Staskawiczbacteria bacterium]
MIIGVLSDTHNIDDNVIKHVVDQLKRVHKATHIFHCGDIEHQHLSSELFGNLPVVCALNQEQLEKEPFDEALRNPPPGWQFTIPGDRVRDIQGIRCYIGHKLSYNLAAQAEADFKARLDILRKDHDGLQFVCAGHMHHQVLAQTQLVTFINPGAIHTSPDGYEFAILNTDKGEVIFSRIPKTRPLESPFTIGIISDTLDIAKRDADFYKKLTKEFADRDVSEVIHCGNIATCDIGREELANFQVHYRLRPDQICPRNTPPNWHLIPKDPPIVEICERQFYVHPSLARVILDKSEAEMHRECLKISESHPEISFILFGNTNDAYFVEEMDGRTRIMNPGDALSSRNFATICFPRYIITIGRVPFDPLPPLTE